MNSEFTEQERKILRLVQDNLPDDATPYATIAAMAGCTEDAVIAFLKKLSSQGAIRRFGASIKHQKTGWNHNAMVAWRVGEEEAEEQGKKAAAHTHVSHCYFRPSPAEDWPYTLFTMVHGRSAEECQAVVAELAATLAISEYAILESLKEMKKSTMKYF